MVRTGLGIVLLVVARGVAAAAGGSSDVASPALAEVGQASTAAAEGWVIAAGIETVVIEMSRPDCVTVGSRLKLARRGGQADQAASGAPGSRIAPCLDLCVTSAWSTRVVATRIGSACDAYVATGTRVTIGPGTCATPEARAERPTVAAPRVWPWLTIGAGAGTAGGAYWASRISLTYGGALFGSCLFGACLAPLGGKGPPAPSRPSYVGPCLLPIAGLGAGWIGHEMYVDSKKNPAP